MAHKEMKAELTCPICMELFRQPRRLPCGHAYCHRCISTLLQVRAQQDWISSRRLICPECRDEMRVDYVLGIEALPLDFKLSRLVELMRSMETNSSDGDDSLSPAREFPESRPIAASSSASSSPSLPTPPTLTTTTTAAAAAPISEGFDFNPPNSSSPPPPYSENETQSPEAENRRRSYNVPFPEVEDLPRTEYDDYLDTLTYPQLWNEASLALNGLLESFQNSQERLSLLARSPVQDTDDHHLSSSSSSLSSSLSSFEFRSGRRRLSSSSSSSLSNDEQQGDQEWSIPSSTNVDTGTTAASTAAITATADNNDIDSDEIHSTAERRRNRWSSSVPNQENLSRTPPSPSDREDDSNVSNRVTRTNRGSDLWPLPADAANSSSEAYRLTGYDTDTWIEAISNLHLYLIPGDPPVYCPIEERGRYLQTSSERQISNTESNSQDLQTNSEGDIISNADRSNQELLTTSEREISDTERIGNPQGLQVNSESTDRDPHDLEISSESQSHNSNADYFKEFLRLRSRMPQRNRSNDNQDENDNLGFERSEENNVGESKKGRDNFRIKYLKLKKRVVNIFKDSYSTTESSDEEIQQERERQRQRDRKKEEEVKEKERLSVHRQKFNRERRKWRMTRHLMSLIMSDYGTSSSDSDSELKDHKNGRRQGEAMDKSRDEMMEKDGLVNDRRHRQITNSMDIDSSGQPVRSHISKIRRKIRNRNKGEDERMSDVNENDDSDDEDDGDDDDDDDMNFRRAIAASDSNYRLGPDNTSGIHTQMPSPSHDAYPLPSIPPLPSVYDNIGDNTTNQAQACSFQNTSFTSLREVTRNNGSDTVSAHLSTQRHDENPILPSACHSITQVKGNLDSNVAVSVTNDIQPVSSAFSHSDSFIHPCRDTVVPRRRFASENEEGGTFYDNLCEREVAQAVQRRDSGERLAERSVNHCNGRHYYDTASISARPEIENLKMSSDDTRNDFVHSELVGMEFSHTQEENVEPSELQLESTLQNLSRKYLKKDMKSGNDSDDNCEIESLKYGGARHGALDESVQKKELNSSANACSQSGPRSSTEVKPAKPPRREINQRKRNVKQQSDGAKIFRPVKSVRCHPPNAVSLYDNVVESRHSMQAGGEFKDKETWGFPHYVTSDIESRRDDGMRHDAGKIIDRNQIRLTNDNLNGQGNEQNVIPCVPTIPVAHSFKSETQALGISVSTAAVPFDLPTSLSSPAADTGCDGSQSLKMKSCCDGNDDNNNYRGVNDNGAFSQQNRKDVKNKIDNNNDDDDSDLEASAPHSAMLKYSSGSGIVGGGKKPKSRFRKFISSLMWVSSSSSSDIDADVDESSDF